MQLRRDAELLYEVGTMRHMARTWRQFGGINFANIAEHTMRVAWIALVLATREGADSGKVVQLALVHDAPETRTGDVHYVSRLYADLHEDKAFDDMVTGTSVEWIRHLRDEYESQNTIEAKIVKDADTLDVDFELMEQAAAGSQLPALFRPIRDGISGRLRTESAKRLYSSLCSTNPHSWHLEGENRATAGDWRGLANSKTSGPHAGDEAES
ncbi:HD domain-containing protein [Actinoplanes philippinensis]|uniref:HD domain-containing protein n=1 Tax=Actinoplanes philippinensis TaxID=35752 RepID=UPI0033DFB51D